jgi:hypothetical protein
MEAPPHQAREASLNYLAYRVAPMFERLGAPLPEQMRIAIGFTSSGRRSRHIGECWDNQCSEDRHFEIFIRPDLGESKELMPMQVAAILGHELVHAAVGAAAGHRKEFRRVARGIGLVGQMAATTAGPQFEEALRRYWKKQDRCPMADCSRALAPAVIPVGVKGSTLAELSASVPLAAMCLILPADGSTQPAPRFVRSTGK